MLGAFLVFLVPFSALLLCVRSSPETNMHRAPMVLGAGLIFLVFAASAWVAWGVLRTTIGAAVSTDTALHLATQSLPPQRWWRRCWRSSQL